VSGELERRDAGAGSGRLVEVLGRLSDSALDDAERRRLLAGLTGLLAGTARAAGARAVLSGRWLTDVVADLAPHVPVRDLLTLRDHHGGRTGDALAAELIRTAARASAGLGAAGGALAAVQYAAPPTLLAAPVQIAAETLAVVAVELKLVAELHVVYGQAPLASRSQVAATYLSAWVDKKALDPGAPMPSMGAVLGTTARRQLRNRLARRAGRNLGTLAPLLAGAIAGAELNRRETRSLGDQLAVELRARARPSR
jgi:hypothetical protein